MAKDVFSPSKLSRRLRAKYYPSPIQNARVTFTKRKEVEPVEDDDLLGTVILETPEQVERLDNLKKRVNAELVRRGARKG